jgi:hypothetical protein
MNARQVCIEPAAPAPLFAWLAIGCLCLLLAATPVAAATTRPARLPTTATAR